MAKKQAGYFPNMYPKKGGREFQLRTGITAPSEIFHEGQTVYFEKTRWCAGPPSANVPTSTIRTYGIVTNDCIHFPFSGTRYYSSTYGSPTDKLADAPLPQVKIIIHRLNVLYNRCPVVKGIAQEPGITITDETVIDLHNSDRWVTTVDRADIRPGKSTNDDVLTNILEICSGKYPPPPLYG